MTIFQSIVGRAMLAIWCDVDPAQEDELDTWHVHEHLPERVGISGFLRARRYVKIGRIDAEKLVLLTLYEAESVEALASSAYIERLDNPTPLTRETVHLMGSMRRSALRLVATRGQGVGGYLLVWQFHPYETGFSDDLRRLATEMVSKALDPVAVVAAHVFEPEVTATRAKDATAEARVTDSVAEEPPWLLLVEAIAERGLVEAEKSLAAEVASLADEGRVTVDGYRLSIVLSEPAGAQL